MVTCCGILVLVVDVVGANLFVVVVDGVGFIIIFFNVRISYSQ